jgi:prophage tail gpP-like protein
MGDEISIEADGVTILSGFIEGVSGSIDSSTANITFSGRDLTGDLVDSSVPKNVSSIVGGITLAELCSTVVSALGLNLTIVDKVPFTRPFSDTDITAIGFGGSAGSFLQNFARKRQIVLTTFGNKDLVLYHPGIPSEILYQLDENSLLKRDFAYTTKDRFNKIEVGSEDNFAQEDYEALDSAISRTGSFLDSSIRSTRYLQIQAEESMTDSELQSRAEEEVNIRRASGLSYSCTVPSHKYLKGDFIFLRDSLSGVRGVFLIRSVEYISTKSADLSNLVLTFPETYSAVGERTTKRKSKMAEDVGGYTSDIAGVNGIGVGTVLRSDFI